jgi:hypothetical protein
VRRGTGGQPAGTLVREAIGELRVHLRVRQELRGKFFRSSRPIAGSDRPDPRPPAYRPAPATTTKTTKTSTTTTKTEAVTV